MNLQKLAIAVLIFVGGLAAVTYVAKGRFERRRAGAATSADSGALAAEKPTAGTPPSGAAETAPEARAGADEGKEQAPAARAPAAKAKKPSPAVTMAPGAAEPAQSIRWFGPAPEPIKKPVIGSVGYKSRYLFAVEVNTQGAAVETVKLRRHFATVEDKRLFNRDPARYEQARKKNPRKFQGRYSLMNPVAYEGKRYRPLATRKIHVWIEGSELPLENLDLKSWKVVKQSEDSVTLTYTLYRGRDWGRAKKNPVLRITKTYKVRRDDYTMDVSVGLENLSARPIKVTLDQMGPTGLPREDVRGDARQGAYGKLLAVEEKVQVSLIHNKDLRNDESALFQLGRHSKVGTSDSQEPTLWIGHVNKFFGAMMYLLPESGGREKPGKGKGRRRGDAPAGPTEAQLDAPNWKAEFYLASAQESTTSRTFLTGVTVPELELPAGESRTVKFELFAGPKKRGMFSNEGSPYFQPRYKHLSYISTIDLKGCFCTFTWLSFAMMWLLDVFSVAALGNYGVAIILLVVLVRLVLHPLMRKQQVSMVKMQKLAPQMNKLKEKYANDKQTLQKEMMKMYKEQGATPLMGCLPMFLQMPIWIALWTSLNANVELRHAAFLPVWITDLAGPDALFKWSPPLIVPLLGAEISSFNLLPILLTVAMFLQTKLNPQMNQAAATDQQKSQQKMMMFMMPAFMLFIFYGAPSGLTLYIMASTFAGVAEQYVIRKHLKARDEMEKMRETTVSVPGKGPRSGRPRKPKGPFWVKKG